MFVVVAVAVVCLLFVVVGRRVCTRECLRPGGRSMSGVGGMTPRGKVSVKTNASGAVVFVAPVGQEVAFASRVSKRLLPNVGSPHEEM